MEKAKQNSALGGVAGFFKRNSGTLVGLVLLCIIISLRTNKFLTSANLMNLLRSNSVNIIICCGMLFAILMGQIDISVGSTLGFTGVMAAYLITNLNMPVWATILICLLLGALIGTFNGICISYIGIPAFVATLATMSVGRGFAQILTGGVSIRVREESFTTLASLSIGDFSIIVLYAVVILILTWVLLNKTRFGYYVYAIGGNRVAAQYSGINVKLFNMLPYVFIGTLCGIGGVIWTARLGSAAATLGSGFEMDAIASVVIGGTSMSGGVGTVGGTLIGALIIGVLNNGLNLMGVNTFWQDVFKGFIIIIAVIIDVVRKRKSQ